MYIILQLVDCPDVDLKSQLSNVTLTLDVFASNASSSEISPETHAAITEELIFSSSVQDTDDPLVIVQALSGKNESTHTHIYIIWKSQAYLRMYQADVSLKYLTSL